MRETCTFHFQFSKPGPRDDLVINYNFAITADNRNQALKQLMVDLRNIANEVEETIDIHPPPAGTP